MKKQLIFAIISKTKTVLEKTKTKMQLQFNKFPGSAAKNFKILPEQTEFKVFL